MQAISTGDIEDLLTRVAADLTVKARSQVFKTSPDFELAVRDALQTLGGGAVEVDYDPHPHVFPDIALDRYGVEVKFTRNDTWRSVANSIFEGHALRDVEHVYVMFGKMGGLPEVRWGRYADCVMHVRTSHVPRFELEIGAQESLFHKIGIEYDDFREAAPHDKMEHVRKYARGRLKPGERLWWLDDTSTGTADHSLPMNVVLYMNLPQWKKRQLRREAALLCPQIVGPSRQSGLKYADPVMYILTYHGVLCPQARDLFSAGSVAGRERGGNYLSRALKGIEDEMREAADRLEMALFEEYWGEAVEPHRRIREWLRRADELAVGWKPSEELFRS